MRIFSTIALILIIDTIIAQKKSSNISIDILYQPAIASNIVSHLPNKKYTSDNYVTKNNYFKYGYSSGILFNYRISDKTFFSTGIIFSNKGYSDSSIATYNFPVISENNTNWKNSTFHDNYYFMDIPITLKSELFSFNKFCFNINYGIMIDIFLKGTSNIKNYYYDGTSDESNRSFFLSHGRVNFSTLIGFECRYSINQNINFFIQPGFDLMLITVNTMHYNWGRVFLYDFGARVGCSYRF